VDQKKIQQLTVVKMNSTIEHQHHGLTLMKAREGRIAPARSVRLKQQSTAFSFDQGRWGDLPPHLAKAYARYEEKSKNAIRERLTM
jgi:hypothetical protein